MNHGEIFILSIIVLVLAAGIARRYLAMRHTMPREDPAYRAKLAALEERVRTLERIVTDKGYDLKRELDQL